MQVSKLRKAKADLECELAGVDFPKLAAQHDQTRQLELMVEEVRLEKDRVIMQLKHKLKWWETLTSLASRR